MTEGRPDDLKDRMLALLDGELDAGGIRRLDADLKASREARDLFRQLATLHSVLEEQGEARTQIGRTLIPMERLLADQRRAMVRNSLVAAAAVVLLSALVLWVKMIPQAPVTLGEFRAASGALFSVAHADEDEATSGNELREGSRLLLSQGTIEVNLVSGVRCVVQGPANLKLLAGNRVGIPEGSAWFEVPPPAVGFTVETPQLTAVDLGTRFGVLARPDQGDQVHVIEGSVSVKAAGPDKAKEALVLATGDACEVLAGGGFGKIELNPGAFVTALPDAITFVDADVDWPNGNTVLDGPGSFGETTSEMPNSFDGRWSVRTRAGVSGGSVLTSAVGEKSEPRLRTSFGLPKSGRYAIYGYFWNNRWGQGSWDVAFQLGSGRAMTVYTKDNAVNLASFPQAFTGPVPTDDGTGQNLFQAELGVWNTSTDGNVVTVYIDDPVVGAGVLDERTWYDGVGFRRLPDE
ncbi:FecR domain-containing protein [Haloferula sp. A504]|uniref:FecR domain-containing protein n=1 Tax=Haloferula sp. A504 TaxID=3373601 RepID=UPI0031C6F85B|nr:FecR family protein [Verrucomicrobiaceae bacterium E54]